MDANRTSRQHDLALCLPRPLYAVFRAGPSRGAMMHVVCRFSRRGPADGVVGIVIDGSAREPDHLGRPRLCATTPRRCRCHQWRGIGCILVYPDSLGTAIQPHVAEHGGLHAKRSSSLLQLLPHLEATAVLAARRALLCIQNTLRQPPHHLKCTVNHRYSSNLLINPPKLCDTVISRRSTPEVPAPVVPQTRCGMTSCESRELGR